MRICGARAPHRCPLPAVCSGATGGAPGASGHAWPCLPVHLEQAAATSAFPLGLLAPAACRVPGGLIKFDLFFPPLVKVYHPHLRRPDGLFSVLYGLGESRAASPCVPSCVQSRGRREGGVPRLQGCRGRASQPPATLPWPRIYPRSPARAPSLSHPWSRGPSRRERNVLIFLLGEVVLARNGLFSGGGERGVRLALFICRFDRKRGTPFLK